MFLLDLIFGLILKHAFKEEIIVFFLPQRHPDNGQNVFNIESLKKLAMENFLCRSLKMYEISTSCYP